MKNGTLRGRLLFLLAAALTPFLLFAIIQAVLSFNNERVDRQNAVLSVSENAIGRVKETLSTTETLLSLFETDIINGNCKRIYDKIVPGTDSVNNVVHFDADGVATCSATRPAGFEIGGNRLQDVKATDEEVMRSEAFKDGADDWVMGLYRKHTDDEGKFAGISVISLNLLKLDALAGPSLIKDVEIALADQNGIVFGSTRFNALSTHDLQEVGASNEGRLYVKDATEGKMDVVVRTVSPEKLFAIISRPSPGVFSKFSVAPASTIGLPLLSFSVALLAVWLALDFLVLRWLQRLRALSRSYGAGHYNIEVTGFEKAPQELVDLSSGMEKMAKKIAERDASLLAALEARDAAVKEIHHRVKNNLQIVTSFLNLQSRQVKHDEAKIAIASARHRIDALSIVHQTLYQYERLEVVDIKAFLDTLLSHLAEALGMNEMNVKLERNIANGHRKADDAIPIALFVLEAVTNAMKYAFDENGGIIQVTLVDVNDQGMLLSITDNGTGVAAEEMSPEGTGLGKRLMKAFSKQLGGTLTYETGVGAGFSAQLLLPPE